MNVSGNGFAAIAAMKKRMASLPAMQERVAERANPKINELALQAFDAGVSVYGDAREARKDGSARTLKKSGDLRKQVRFVRTGTRLRAVLGVKYARFHIKHGILPRGGAALPVSWTQAIKVEASAEFAARMGAR